MSDTRAPACDALVIGGGPAGAAMGILLARHGRTVDLLEQTASAHHKVCGEFLSHEAIASLEWLGVAPLALGAVPIHGVRLHGRATVAECELPFPALSLTRRTLDEALLLRAEREGVRVHRGRRVEALKRMCDGWQVYVSGGEIHTAQTALLATGKHDLHGHRRPRGLQSNLVAFKMYFKLTAEATRALGDWVELFLFPGGYAGLQLVEGGQANLCLLVTRDRLARCGGAWTALLEHMRAAAPPLAARLECAIPMLDKPLAISSIPYGLLPGNSDDGLWRIGDQAAVIPSFAGDGMSMALHSAMLAAEMAVRGSSAAEFAQVLREHFRGQVHLATTISRLMIAAPVMAQLARLWPGLLGRIAAKTRISSVAPIAGQPVLRHNGAGARGG